MNGWGRPESCAGIVKFQARKNFSKQDPIRKMIRSQNIGRFFDPSRTGHTLAMAGDGTHSLFGLGHPLEF